MLGAARPIPRPFKEADFAAMPWFCRHFAQRRAKDLRGRKPMSPRLAISLGAAAMALALLATGKTGWAGELEATYFTVVERGDPDFNTRGCCVFSRHLVQSTLGPNGLPVLDPAYGASGTGRYVVHDVDAAGEITWWTPGATVAPTGAGVAALPIVNDRFFPPNGAGPDNAHGFQTAVFKGVLHVPRSEAVHFRIGADDVAFLYLDGTLVADLGGVHPRIDLPAVTEVLQAGDYCLVLFYADLYPDHAALFFSIETADVIIAAAPSDAQAPISPTHCSVPVS
jgi:hypothetical protein